jgi:hypothetical protein
MSMLGLGKSLPVNHRLRGVYRVIGGIVGVLLVVFGILGFVVSGDVLGAPASAGFSAICLVAGLVMILAAVQGRNAAAEANAYVGAALIVLGFVCLLTQHTANFLGTSMVDVMILFIGGTAALAAGFYGRIGEPEHQPAGRDPDPSARA